MEDEHILNDCTDDVSHLTVTASNNWKEWLEVIENELKKESESETDRPNAYRNVQFTKMLKKDILLLPLWTKLLETKMDYGSIEGSTASCEGEINKIENIVFKDIKNKTIRVDIFVQRHIEYLFGEILLADANSEVDQYKLDQSSLRESQDLQERENWKGKIIKTLNVQKIDSVSSYNSFIEDNKENIKKEKSKTDTTIIKFPKNEEKKKCILKDISNKLCIRKQLPLYLGHQKDRISQKLQYKQPDEMGIFKHCSNVHLAAHEIDGISYSLLNSCPFDSLVQALFIIGTDDENIKKMVGK